MSTNGRAIRASAPVALVLAVTTAVVAAAAGMAPAALGLGLGGTRQEAITLAVRPSVTDPHRPITAYGTVSTAEENAQVTVQFKGCVTYPPQFRDAAQVTAKEGGSWSASLVPETSGILRAIVGADVSKEVRILRRADVRLVPAMPGHYRAMIEARRQFWRKRVRIERSDRVGARWTPLRTVVLGHTQSTYGLSKFVMSSSDVFRVNVPAGTRLRAVFPLSQAKPCYAAGCSKVLQK